jgi:cystathionine beta-lyase
MAKSWKTRLIHSDVQVPEGYRSLASPVFRGSTTLFPDAASVEDSWDQHEVGYTYGLYGTPTTLELAGKICELEKGYRTMITPGGQGAISLISLAFLKSGDHILIPESVYSPNRKLAYHMLRRFGVEAGFYPPDIGSGVKDLMRENTRLVWCESPGSITMEVQDVPAMSEAAHARGALVALDNTWSAGVYFDAFAQGVDITMQALTKYVAAAQRFAAGVGDGEGSEAIPAIRSDAATSGECGLAGRLQSGLARHADHGGATEAHRGLGLADCALAGGSAGD